MFYYNFKFYFANFNHRKQYYHNVFTYSKKFGQDDEVNPEEIALKEN